MLSIATPGSQDAMTTLAAAAAPATSQRSRPFQAAHHTTATASAMPTPDSDRSRLPQAASSAGATVQATAERTRGRWVTA